MEECRVPEAKNERFHVEALPLIGLIRRYANTHNAVEPMRTARRSLFNLAFGIFYMIPLPLTKDVVDELHEIIFLKLPETAPNCSRNRQLKKCPHVCAQSLRFGCHATPHHPECAGEMQEQQFYQQLLFFGQRLPRQVNRRIKNTIQFRLRVKLSPNFSMLFGDFEEVRNPPNFCVSPQRNSSEKQAPDDSQALKKCEPVSA